MQPRLPRVSGLLSDAASLNNSVMKRNAYVFGWDEEPSDERPSEFAPTTGYSALSGYHQPMDLSRRIAHRQSRAAAGLGRMAIAFIAIVGAAGYAMYLFAKLMHG